MSLASSLVDMYRGTLSEDGESFSQVSPCVQIQFIKSVFNVCKTFVGAKTDSGST